MSLVFQMESGRSLPVLTRFEQPITVRVVNPMPAITRSDLAQLLDRLRVEAGIGVTLTDRTDANIVIETVPARAMRRLVPHAACFVVPRVQSWADLPQARRSGAIDWSTLAVREKAAIFIPDDAAPQEMRDCLHEELAQALGPLNDLFELPDSVFNDDNVHAVLTSYDMLILRAIYHPKLQSGMSAAEVAERLPSILAQINPTGSAVPTRLLDPTSAAWKREFETAIGAGGNDRQRLTAAERAIVLAEQAGWTDHRLGFAYYVHGRLLMQDDPARALERLIAADRLLAMQPLTDLHRTHVAAQTIAFALHSGDAEMVLAITERAMPIARQYQNAALLAVMMMFRAEALDLLGQSDAAQRQRLDSLGWARYGFGSRAAVIDQLNAIAALAPQSAQS